ncbi:MAG: Zn-dependent hydrolase [Myxococcota bacterium]
MKPTGFSGDIMRRILCVGSIAIGLACSQSKTPQASASEASPRTTRSTDPEALLERYASVRLEADLSGLSDDEKRMLPLLIEAAEAMDQAFWLQAYGPPDPLLGAIDDPALTRLVKINYGPWDRLDDNRPFVEGFGEKPQGARFYPIDATIEELESGAPALRSLYTMVERTPDGGLQAIPYSTYFADPIKAAAARLEQAAKLAPQPALKRHLVLRAEALRTDRYRESDLAWMSMKDNTLDVVIGPIETYEDRLLGAKAAFESFVLIKDRAWSKRLQRYAALLPTLQSELPVDAEYRSEIPGTDSDLNAYDVVYYAGDCNAGGKTIAINLPNDEQVQLEKGTRRLQLKNAMQAKFDRILVPIAQTLLVPEQRQHVTFDAFFANTMFHEVAHGLGIKNTVDGSRTVREALRDRASALEEGKADVLGLYMITSLHRSGELEGDAPLEDYLVTFVGSIFRSIRFGAASAHGRANLVRFNFFRERDALSLDRETGLYRVEPKALEAASTELSRAILKLQGDGDYQAASAFVERYGNMPEELRSALQRLGDASIPVDVVFEQGISVLGLDSNLGNGSVR